MTGACIHHMKTEKKFPPSPRSSKLQMQTDEETIDEKTKDVIMGGTIVIMDGSSPHPESSKITENKETRELLKKIRK